MCELVKQTAKLICKPSCWQIHYVQIEIQQNHTFETGRKKNFDYFKFKKKKQQQQKKNRKNETNKKVIFFSFIHLLKLRYLGKSYFPLI